MCLRYPEAEKWSPPVIYYTTCYPHHKYICLRTILILSPLFLSNGPWITKNCFPFLFQAIFYLKANIISLQSFQELKYVLFFLFDQILENIKPLSTLSDEPSPTCPYPTLRTMLKIGHNTSDPPYARGASNVRKQQVLYSYALELHLTFFWSPWHWCYLYLWSFQIFLCQLFLTLQFCIWWLLKWIICTPSFWTAFRKPTAAITLFTFPKLRISPKILVCSCTQCSSESMEEDQEFQNSDLLVS